MADTGEIVAGATGLGAFFGAFYGAVKFFGRKPGRESENNDHGDLEMLRQQVAFLEQRQNNYDTRINDVFRLFEDMSKMLGDMRSDLTRALTQLEERRRK